MFQTPDDLLNAAWQALSRGVADRRHPARHPTFATHAQDGPQMRTVVLREWDDGVAEFHTDAASAKIAELRADPRAALHVWVPKQRLQIRLTGRAELILSDPDRWAQVPDSARAVYGGDPTPGERIPAPDAFTEAPSLSRFMAIRLITRNADILHLGDDLHRRIAAKRAGSGWTADWVAP